MNPIIEITCVDKKKYSATKKDIGPTSTVSWDEHIFFEPKNMVKSQFVNKFVGKKRYRKLINIDQSHE